MKIDEFHRLKNLFNRLAEFPHEERLARMMREDQIGESTRQHLRSLLEADAALSETTARQAIGAFGRDDATRWIGRRVGAFVIDRELGQGGMGSVFLAHRGDGSVEQKVAIKLIRPEQLDEHTLMRFRLERQVLAMLKHPHIGAMLDLGELDDGTPFVVMEYVEGEPITGYCASHHCDLKQRLRLFLDVCNAVSYAHRSMVVHRDIKPGNILVTAEGQTKLLDFGIAKPLLARFGTQEIQETGAAQRFFSPSNAAPEQLRGEPATVACDVYGLGILLYELLCGERPFNFEGKTPGEVEHLILDQEPAPPSQRARRRALRGDLDAIVLRALRKDPMQRYASVDQFADDVRRYLDGRPVEARKGRTWYRVRKFVPRHRWSLSAAAAFFVLTTSAGVVFLMQAAETVRQRDRAQHATGFLVEAFRAADPEKALGEKVTAKEILDQAARSLEFELQDDPALRAELLGRIAEVKVHLQSSKQALPLVIRALDDAKQVRARDPELYAWLLELEVRVAIRAEDFELASRALAETKSVDASLDLKAALEEDTIELLFMGGATNELKPHIQTVLTEILPQLARNDPRRADLIFEIVRAEDVAGVGDGISLLENLLSEQKGGLTPPVVAKSQLKLADLYNRSGRKKDARKLMESARPMIEKFYGADSVAMASWKTNMAGLYSGDGQYDSAGVLYRELLAGAIQRYGEMSGATSIAQFNLASNQEEVGHFYAAEEDYKKAIEIASKVWPETNENVDIFRTAYALMLNRRDRFAEAVPLLEKVISRADRDSSFKDDEVFKVGTFGLAIARYGVAPSPSLAEAYKNAATALEGVAGDSRDMANAQIEVAKKLGLPDIAASYGDGTSVNDSKNNTIE